VTRPSFRRTFLLGSAIVGVTAASGQALARPGHGNASGAVSDARCLLAMVALSRSKRVTAARTGSLGIAFFSGRVSADDPNFDFSQLHQIGAKLDLKHAQADLDQHCGPLMARTLDQVKMALTPPSPSGNTTPPAPQP
jgi:hypothetical protein